jgi:hypothetical protein
MGRSIRTPRWRYTEWAKGKHGIELYDHASDPGEYYNLGHDRDFAGVVCEMKQLLGLGFETTPPKTDARVPSTPNRLWSK